MIAIIDYDAGNLKSVEKALIYLGEKTIVTRDYHELLQADKVILPGVGSFGDAMRKLKKYDMIKPIMELTERGTPFLGICLGMQLLYESSDETPGTEGLSLLKGKILKIPAQEGLKIPHMGWNSISIKEDASLFKGISNHSYVYFVHSYYLKAENEAEVSATTHYSTCIHASVEKKNIFGCQFHPEKSGKVGLQILKNFAGLGKEAQ